MKLMNERAQVQTVAKRWRKQYGDSADTSTRMIGDELAALDTDNATVADVAKITGNGSWVYVKTCHECGAEDWDAVEVGKSPYESSTATICGDCLRAALRLLGDSQEAAEVAVMPCAWMGPHVPLGNGSNWRRLEQDYEFSDGYGLKAPGDGWTPLYDKSAIAAAVAADRERLVGKFMAMAKAAHDAGNCQKRDELSTCAGWVLKV